MERGRKMAEKNTRQANFELLRIIAMLMVITMHFLSHTGALPEAGPGKMPGERELFGVLVESFCIVAVNVYVLLSGYFLCEKEFSLKRLLRLIAQVLFYTILIPVVLAAAGVISLSEALNLYHLWNCLFPVQSAHYWFVTAYVIMVLFSPVLNAAVKAMSRKQLKLTLICLLIFFCIGKSMSIILFSSDNYGYDYGWFLFLYLTAAYIRNYGSAFFSGKKRCALLYVGSCLAIALIVLACLFVCAKTGALEYYVNVPFHYNFVFVFTGAVALFELFSRIRLRDSKLTRLICRIAPATFGVYLIHEHADISMRWTDWLVGTPSAHLVGYLIQMAESVVIVFVVCVCIDLLRAVLFRYAEKVLTKAIAGMRKNHQRKI